MKIIHFCAGLEGWNGMANTARQFVAEEVAAGYESRLTNRVEEIDGGIDAVYVHGAWLPAVHQAAKRAKAIGAKLIIRPAGSYDPVRLGFHGFKKWLMGPWERAMLRRADVVLATCEAEAEWIREYLGRGSESGRRPRIEITDLKRFFRLGGGNAEKRSSRDGVWGGEIKVRGEGEQRWGGRTEASTAGRLLEKGGGERLHVLYLGRQHPLKGVKFLERAVREVNEKWEVRNEKWEVRNEKWEVRNEKWEVRNEKWEMRNEKCGEAGVIELREVSDAYGEELEKVWEWCDVLCLPTLSENFGRVVAEALERGKRVITTDGAPAWETGMKDEGREKGWELGVVYLRGYREGTDETRVRLLKEALREFVG